MITAFLIHSRLTWYQCVEPVDDDVVARRLAQVERLDRHPLDLEAHRVASDRQRQVEPLDDLLVADRPADVGAERQSDAASDGDHVRRLHRPSDRRCEQPRQGLSEAVAPADPRVPIEVLHEPDVHARCRQNRYECAVLADERLVCAARDEYPLGDRSRFSKERLHELANRVPQPFGRLRQPAPAPANEPDCSSRRPKNPGAARATASDATAPKLDPITQRPAGLAARGNCASSPGTSSSIRCR